MALHESALAGGIRRRSSFCGWSEVADRRQSRPMKYLTLIICALTFAGCGKGDESPIGGGELQSPLTESRAWFLAKMTADAQQGYVARLNQHSHSDSMGQAVSKHAWVVIVPDWQGTRRGDVISAWAQHQHRKSHILHQVIARDPDGAIRTAGTNNSLPDFHTVFKQNYKGTMIAQFYYRDD